MSSPSPLTIPFKFRRKSSSASTSVSMDNQYTLSDSGPSSPLQSSSPLLTPLHLTRRYEHTRWQAGDYFDDLDGVIHDQQSKFEDAAHPLSCHTRLEHPLPCRHLPLPSLMTKFAAHTLRSDAPLSYSPSPFSSVSQTTYLYPQGDSAIADDCEEYDLESMDIHIRETYFATSAERGRWLSSPIATRVRFQAIPPTRGHSSPVNTLADASPSPVRERLRRQKRSYSLDKQLSISSSEDRDEDIRCSSSLPPSSPLSSPMSSLSFLDDDCKDDSIADSHSNSDDCHSLTGTLERSISTTCTSPVEPTRTPSPHKVPVIVPALHPTGPHCHSPDSVIPHHASPSPNHLPMPIDVHVHAPGTSGFEPDGILSPLSQFEMDLSAVEPLKLPLSDTVNKPYPELHTASPGVTVDPARSPDGPPFIQSSLMNSYHELLGVSLATVGSSSCNRAKKRRESTAGNPGARRTKKRPVIRSRSPSSNANKGRGAESHTPTHSEPPSKKSKMSHCRADSENRGTRSLPRCSEIPNDERLSRSPSRAAIERCDSEPACPRDRKTRKPRGHAEPQRPTPSPSPTLVTTDIDVEFHASLTGMLIEAFATSRATSMDSLALYLVITQAHPHLAVEQPKKELLKGIAAVLEAGRARCGMFEKVDSSGEKSRHKALENRWFYVPERDEDSERAALISAIMPRQKRKETKKYKQYYYRPLDKMSRWDPEDAP